VLGNHFILNLVPKRTRKCNKKKVENWVCISYQPQKHFSYSPTYSRGSESHITIHGEQESRKKRTLDSAIGQRLGCIGRESLAIQVVHASSLKHLQEIFNDDPLGRIVLLRCVDGF